VLYLQCLKLQRKGGNKEPAPNVLAQNVEEKQGAHIANMHVRIAINSSAMGGTVKNHI